MTYQLPTPEPCSCGCHKTWYELELVCHDCTAYSRSTSRALDSDPALNRWQEVVEAFEHQQAEIVRLRGFLTAITEVAGNLPDDRLERGTSNDAVARGIMVINARIIARAALKKDAE